MSHAAKHNLNVGVKSKVNMKHKKEDVGEEKGAYF